MTKTVKAVADNGKRGTINPDNNKLGGDNSEFRE